MKFKDYKYERPNYEEIKKSFLELVDKIKNASTYDEQKLHINQLNNIRKHIETMSTLASIRNSINTADEFYDEEQNYWDEQGPLYTELNSDFYKVIVNSKFKDEIKKDYSEQFYKICEYSLKSFSPEIISDLQEENKLMSKYTKLLASAKINFKGEELNLSGLYKYMLSSDRNEREQSSKVYYNYFGEHEEEFDEIYDQLVHIRHNMAKKLGFKNFVELGYIRMDRTDYNPEMVVNLRKQILEYIVPLCNKLYEKQAKRLNLDKLTYIDENLEFLDGNATIKGDSDYIIENGIKMYQELSQETKEFFDFMLENELMDLETKHNKSAGGYCTYIPDYKAPFIFSNFNKTSEDMDVLTHEAGHAFQLYMSRDIDMQEINFPTLDSCEIHSMSMEFITYPWMETFFKEDSDKYKFAHLTSAIKFLPYGVVVDEFQHVVYDNPNMTSDERKKVWRDLEKKYLPHRDYEDNEILERGCWFFKQGHIFKDPFYYIDYVLAQICAFQFLKKMEEDRVSGWEDYLRICKVGGTQSFLQIVKTGNLISPFDDKCIEYIIKNLETNIEKFERNL
ncbi:MAG: M3 family oligoendopeptidase [Clostridiales bacterium]|uniref:M3 family oligoendopeptidase n=1 Tax=Terrisporobacter sp. TaxID=1965305 RepID=UPI002A4F7820|nr:M3 family oligoendopeptidase [Terrisporobacter sp.]MDD7753879.1 M3 family oligoendopeptidase [Clostridiales bacterium]MDY4136107.1 M3 family oligoendopeptidase [Terrisporobacter sp.]